MSIDAIPDNQPAALAPCRISMPPGHYILVQDDRTRQDPSLSGATETHTWRHMAIFKATVCRSYLLKMKLKNKTKKKNTILGPGDDKIL